MSGITTHVLDTVLGKPAAGIARALEEAGERRMVRDCDRSATDADGRCRDLARDAPARRLSPHL